MSVPLSDPDLEIEITPEMVIAGLRALPYLPSEMLGIHSEESLVREVYQAMSACADPSRNPK